MEYMKVYYSHSKRFLPNADRNAAQHIRRAFPGATIINPRDYEAQFAELYWFEQMDFCFNLLESADVFVFAEYGGYIGKGVYAEVERARSIKKRALLLRKGGFYEHFRVELIDEDWAIRYGRVHLTNQRQVGGDNCEIAEQDTPRRLL